MTIEGIIDKILNALLAFSAVGAFILAVINRIKIKELHVTMNSRLTELLRITDQLGHAEGRAEGMEQGRAEGIEQQSKMDKAPS